MKFRSFLIFQASSRLNIGLMLIDLHLFLTTGGVLPVNKVPSNLNDQFISTLKFTLRIFF
jgi:hypothetical protein